MSYDVIVWDGALGHFESDTIHIMLGKIIKALNNDAVFAGSESLGHEGYDHHQFFKSIYDLDVHFREHFTYRTYRVVEYNPTFNPELCRREAFWRCSTNSIRIAEASWNTLEGELDEHRSD